MTQKPHGGTFFKYKVCNYGDLDATDAMMARPGMDMNNLSEQWAQLTGDGNVFGMRLR